METKPKVLIIDDNIEICYLFSNILRNMSVDFEYVQTLAAARLYINANVPSLVFLDNHLPDGLGVEFLSFIKRRHPETKVVIITGHEVDLNRCLQDGALEIVFKPFTTRQIYSILEKAW